MLKSVKQVLKTLHASKMQLLPSRLLYLNYSKTILEREFSSCCVRSFLKKPNFIIQNHKREFNIAASCMAKKKTKATEMHEKALVKKESMFAELEKMDKGTFLATVDLFLQRSDKHRRHHVEFIYAALRRMPDFGVHRDLETYKKLLDLFPKGIMVAESLYQREFQHYPKQQQCAIDVLDEMEMNGVLPDNETKDILLLTFGDWSYAIRKLYRMMYWMPKFKNANPWPIPYDLPRDSLELARIALGRMTAVDLNTLITVYQTGDIPDNTDTDIWVASAQSPIQQKLLEGHPKDEPLYVEGPHRAWLRYTSLSYFTLRAESVHQRDEPPPEDPDDVSDLPVIYCSEQNSSTEKAVHEQEDGTYLGICITETSSPASLSAWIHFLQLSNPALRDINVLFSLKYLPDDTSLVPTDSHTKTTLEKLKKGVVGEK